jgi:hypothetical protein
VSLRPAHGRLAALAPALGALLLGCNVLVGGSPWGPDRLGAEVDDEACETCHDDVAARLAATPHARVGIACGQCHRGTGHPEFDEPVEDGTCGACHLPEYQQVARSAHARRAVEVPDGTSRRDLRERGFVARTPRGTVFTTRDPAAPRSGRLCAACHFADHALSATNARAGGFCTTCHVGRDEHVPTIVAGDARCFDCHMRRGTTIVGQPVSSHDFLAAEATWQ